MEAREELSKSRLVSTEPVNFTILWIQGVLTTLRTFYIKHRLDQSIDGDDKQDAGQGNESRSFGDRNCPAVNNSDPFQEHTQSQVAVWVMWLEVISVCLPIITGTLLTASSDYVGRRPILIIGGVGHVIACAIYLIVALFNAHLPLLLLTAVALGICGDTIAVTSVSTAYIADSCCGKKRTERLVIQSLLIYAGWGIGQAFGGVFLQFTRNYAVCFSVTLVIAIINLAYTACPGIILETAPMRAKLSLRLIVKEILKNLRKMYSNASKERRWQLTILIAISCLICLINQGVYELIVIYALWAPFCWTPTIVGVFSAAVNLVPAAGR